MIEVVFSESAYGSLRIAQSYGTGKYPGGATSVMILKKDGSHPTQEEDVFDGEQGKEYVKPMNQSDKFRKDDIL